MTTTQNLKLNKPNADDFYSIDVQNENMDIIDGKVAEQEQKLDTAKGTIDNHIASKNNPHGVTKAQVGLGNVNNTADSEKSVKYATSALQDANGNNIADTYTPISTVSDHTGNKSNPHGVTKSQVGLSNVPNVSTNDQAPTYTVAGSNTALASGEKLSVAFGKIAKAVSSLISHLSDTVGHITSAERTAWNNKLNATAKAVDSDKLDGLNSMYFRGRETGFAYPSVNGSDANVYISEGYFFVFNMANIPVKNSYGFLDVSFFDGGGFSPSSKGVVRQIFTAWNTGATYYRTYNATAETWSEWIGNIHTGISVPVVISSTAPSDTTALWVS